MKLIKFYDTIDGTVVMAIRANSTEEALEALGEAMQEVFEDDIPSHLTARDIASYGLEMALQ